MGKHLPGPAASGIHSTPTEPTVGLSERMARTGQSSQHDEVAWARHPHGRKRYRLVESDESTAMMRH